MKEVSENGGNANKSYMLQQKGGAISGHHTQKESLHLTNQTFSVENSAMHLKEQLERYKEAIGDTIFGDIKSIKRASRRRQKETTGRNNMDLSS